MRWLLFLSRLAFVCNIFFLLSVSLQFYDWAASMDAAATILIIGYFMSILINPIVNLIYLLVIIFRKKIDSVPRWLIIANLLFFILQLMFIIFLTANNHV